MFQPSDSYIVAPRVSYIKENYNERLLIAPTGKNLLKIENKYFMSSESAYESKQC